MYVYPDALFLPMGFLSHSWSDFCFGGERVDGLTFVLMQNVQDYSPDHDERDDDDEREYDEEDDEEYYLEHHGVDGEQYYTDEEYYMNPWYQVCSLP